ncbi:acyloxyacyl hydrolase [Massilia horti]|uniref:Lipid A deacylase n=1 Tax=Massilia horti TaxID=2562153 RepID=A0A4Y9SWA8_9BURK|nr:acyloxyacyl hydrolase [Massilia horti]TFW30884.1 acyloxyacyl hydrolase [Massilia horti]
MPTTNNITKALAALTAMFSTHAAFAADGWFDSASVEIGGANKAQMIRLAGQKDWNKRWLPANGYHLSGYWDFNVAGWRGTEYKDVKGDHQYYAVIGVTPVFRYESDDKLGLFGEAGIGASLFSTVYKNAGNHLSTAFEFADHIGVGYALPNRWEFTARVQHYSNGGIKHPNSGVNWLVMKAAYRF